MRKRTDARPDLPEPTSEDNGRSRRVRVQRPATLRPLQRDNVAGLMEYPEARHRQLPLVRAECVGAPRPCPFVTCRHHLYLEANPKNGSIKFTFPDLEPDEIPETCTLDAASRGPLTERAVALRLNVTRTRVQQIQLNALRKLAPLVSPAELDRWTGHS